MNCSEFVARASDYFDGSAPTQEMRSMEEHLRGCASCRRYQAVYEQGTSLLRSLPEPELGEDFGPRLRHRIFHVDDRRALIDNSGSATPALTVLGLAILLTAVAWSPLLRGGAPVVDLDPIVVDHVHTPAPIARYPLGYAGMSVGFASTAGLGRWDGGLWDNARLYEYTRLSKRYARGDAFRRMGFDHD